MNSDAERYRDLLMRVANSNEKLWERCQTRKKLKKDGELGWFTKSDAKKCAKSVDDPSLCGECLIIQCVYLTEKEREIVNAVLEWRDIIQIAAPYDPAIDIDELRKLDPDEKIQSIRVHDQHWWINGNVKTYLAQIDWRDAVSGFLKLQQWMPDEHL